MKLHIGCGKRYLPGYTHVDIQKYDHIDVICNILELDQHFAPNTVDEIYACHVVEHISRHKLESFFKVCYRVLKNDGCLRLSVPDIEKAIDLYKSGTPLYPTLYGLFWGGQKNDFDYHTCGFDFNLMRVFTTKNGFCNLNRYNWRDFLPHDYDDYSRSYLPHMDFDNGTLTALNVVCQKQKPLLIYCTGGFTNAINSVIAGIKFANDNNLKVHIHWVEGYTALGAHIKDIYKIDVNHINLINESDFKQMLSDSKSCHKITHNPSLSLLANVQGPYVDPRHVKMPLPNLECDLVFLHIDALPKHIVENFASYYHEFSKYCQVHQGIQEKVDNFLNSPNCPRIALHLRGTDVLVLHGFKHNDVIQYAHSTASKYKQRILVCTDDQDIRKQLESDDRFVFYNHTAYVSMRDPSLPWNHDEGTDHLNCNTFIHDNVEYKNYSWSNVMRSKDQVIAGIIDLLLMSRMNHLEGFVTSHTSTYFLFAKLLYSIAHKSPAVKPSTKIL